MTKLDLLRAWNSIVVIGFVSFGVPLAGAQPPIDDTAGGVADSQEQSGAHLPRQLMIVALGAAGADEYAPLFREWVDNWRAAAKTASADLVLIGADEPEQRDDASSDGQRLERALAEAEKKDLDRLWIVLIGHGTYDGQAAKFNLRGPDVAAQQLSEWLTPIEVPTIVLNCTSSSGPFINRLSAGNRVVVTATKSGYELNFARFGQYIAGSITDPAADLDKDDQVSVLEAYLTACRQVAEFYDQEARLATEHALLDDNGDGLGTPAGWFRGLRATQRAKEGAELDGLRAHQIHLVVSDLEANMPRELRQQRDTWEREIEELRDQKSELGEVEYYRQLESLMLKLARLYQAVDSRTGE